MPTSHQRAAPARTGGRGPQPVRWVARSRVSPGLGAACALPEILASPCESAPASLRCHTHRTTGARSVPARREDRQAAEVNQVPSSYSCRSPAVAGRAEMIRIVEPTSAVVTRTKLPRADRPTVDHRSSVHECLGSGGERANGSASASRASRNPIPCLRRLASSFPSSHVTRGLVNATSGAGRYPEAISVGSSRHSLGLPRPSRAGARPPVLRTSRVRVGTRTVGDGRRCGLRRYPDEPTLGLQVMSSKARS